MWNRILIVLFCLALAPAPAPTSAAATREYTLGAGDVVKITVYDNPDLTTTARISENGKISFPLIGEIVLANFTAQQASRQLAQALSSGGFVKKPQVNVYVERFHSPLVSILGDVNKPGKYPIRNPEAEDVKTVADLLVLAGGPTANAGDYLTVTQRGPNGETVQKQVDLVALLRRGDMNQNLPIKEGDIVYVPRMEMFYIYGEVQKPGTYRLERGMTLMQALAVGGGITARGTQRGIEIRRKNGDGKNETVKPKLDVALQPNDVVYVKESMF